VSLVRCQGEEPFQKRSASGWSRMLSRKQSHFKRCPRFESLALRQFIYRPIAQKESGRPTPGRPWSVTTSGDHSFLRSSKAEQSADNR